MTTPDLVPDSERRGLIGALPASWRPYASLMRIDRPIGTWLLYWPCAWSIALQLGAFPSQWPLLLWFLLGAFAMRSAGCVYNDIVDRKLDRAVERTRLRPLASGRIGLRSAWALLLALCGTGLLVLFQLEPPAQIVALLSIPLVAAYPFMKRITWWPQACLGLVFSWGALVGWNAAPLWWLVPDRRALLVGELNGVILYLGTVFWVIGYDTLYAIQDKEDDALIGIRSSARRLGRHARTGVGLCYTAALLGWGTALWWLRPEWLVLLALAPAALHLARQVLLIDPNDGERALALFRSNRFTGLLLFLGFAVVGLSQSP